MVKKGQKWAKKIRRVSLIVRFTFSFFEDFPQTRKKRNLNRSSISKACQIPLKRMQHKWTICLQTQTRVILSIFSTSVKFLFLEIYVVPLSEVKQCLVFSPRTSGADLLLTQLILERPRYFQRIKKVSLWNYRLYIKSELKTVAKIKLSCTQNFYKSVNIEYVLHHFNIAYFSIKSK